MFATNLADSRTTRTHDTTPNNLHTLPVVDTPHYFTQHMIERRKISHYSHGRVDAAEARAEVDALEVRARVGRRRV